MLIRRLTLKKILSFNETTDELGPLSVLIGPNAVGKSNLIGAIRLWQAATNGIEGRFCAEDALSCEARPASRPAQAGETTCPTGHCKHCGRDCGNSRRRVALAGRS